MTGPRAARVACAEGVLTEAPQRAALQSSTGCSSPSEDPQRREFSTKHRPLRYTKVIIESFTDKRGDERGGLGDGWA